MPAIQQRGFEQHVTYFLANDCGTGLKGNSPANANVRDPFWSGLTRFPLPDSLEIVMSTPDFDPAKNCARWVSYFDIFGFGGRVEADWVAAHAELDYCQNTLTVHQKEIGNIECAWFSDSFLFYTLDSSRGSLQRIDHASRWFFDDLLEAGIPLRGAMAFGELYVDKVFNIFVGPALVRTAKYGERYDWIGFVLHDSTVAEMEKVGQPVNKHCYKEWRAVTKTGQPEPVLAYLMDFSSASAISRMMKEAGDDHAAKYNRALEFHRHFTAEQPLPIPTSSGEP
jgi:hypothetical protein